METLEHILPQCPRGRDTRSLSHVMPRGRHKITAWGLYLTGSRTFRDLIRIADLEYSLRANLKLSFSILCFE